MVRDPNPILAEGALAPPPKLQLNQMTLWCEYPIWGLLLYDDQSPWLSILEALHICFSRASDKKSIFPGPEQDASGALLHEWMQYSVPLSTGLRTILFNDQMIDDISASAADNASMWTSWEKSCDREKSVDVAHLKKRFAEFRDLARAVALLRSSQIDGNNNRRPTSRHLLPLGRDMIFADVSESKLQPDRRWLRRTGEIVYLMLNRSAYRGAIEALLREKLIEAKSPWDRLARNLKGREADEDDTRSLNTGYLPLPSHSAYERLAQDWLAILALRMPISTSLASLARLTSLNLLLYVVERGVEIVEGPEGHVPPFVLDMVGSSSLGGLRKLSDDLYKRHRRLPAEAMRTFVERFRGSEEWARIEADENAALEARNLLASRFLWKRDLGTDPHAMPSPREQIEDLLIEVQRPRSHSVGAMYVAHGRQAGVLLARAGVGTWYAPTDDLIEALVLANVDGPEELESFLEKLYRRYRIVIGTEEAMKAFDGELPDTEANFRANERSFEDRLRMLGYLQRKSDDCAFVNNPFGLANAGIATPRLSHAAA
jgi:hypothetical protein